MPETWVNYWYYGKDGKLIKTERLPRKDIAFVYETAERPTAQISRHTFFCPSTGTTQKLDAVFRGGAHGKTKRDRETTARSGHSALRRFCTSKKNTLPVADQHSILTVG